MDGLSRTVFVDEKSEIVADENTPQDPAEDPDNLNTQAAAQASSGAGATVAQTMGRADNADNAGTANDGSADATDNADRAEGDGGIEAPGGYAAFDNNFGNAENEKIMEALKNGQRVQVTDLNSEMRELPGLRALGDRRARPAGRARRSQTGAPPRDLRHV